MYKDIEKKRAKDRECVSRYRAKNRDEINRKQREKSAERRRLFPQTPTQRWMHNILYRYGLTPEDYNVKLEAQKGLCALCKKPFDYSRKGTQPALDHCHKSEKVRDFLHNTCNVAIGLLKDDPVFCRLAAEYLEKHVIA